MTYRELLGGLLTMGEYQLDQEVQVSINKRSQECLIDFIMTERFSDKVYLSDSALGFGWEQIRED